MSKEEQTPLDLSGLDFGPAWAKDKAAGRDYSKEVGPREGRDSRSRGPRRDGGGGGGDRRKTDLRGGGPGGDRREQRGGGGDRRQDDRRQGDRRQGDRRQSERREYQPPTPAPEGFVAGVMPVEEGLDNLAREIKGGGRTYSVFDLARVVTGARERFNVTFEAPKGTTFFRCKSDGSIWLTKEESVQQFWRANLLGELYEEVVQTIDPPKGNFNAVAKCGFSGEWLGPPNYHGYPTEVARLHAERFSHMSLEDYKRRIRNESGEEVVQAWLDSQTKRTHYRPLTTEEILALREERKAAEVAKAKKDAADAKPEAPVEKVEAKEAAPETAPEEIPAAPAEDSPAPAGEEALPATESEVAPAASETEAEASSADAEAPSEDAPAAEATEEASPVKESAPVLLADRKEVERHFIDHHFKHLFAEVDRAWVPANVAAKLLSPGLLTLLKDIVSEERRYPAKLTPILCRQLSGRHLAVFKWKKKLKAGPARPHAIPDDLTLAERPQTLLAWIEGNSGKTLEDLWKNCLPENADEDLKRNFYHDLHWLLNQGYVLLMADGTVHLAKGKVSDQPKQEQSKKKAKKKTSQPQKKDDEKVTTETSATNATETNSETEPETKSKPKDVSETQNSSESENVSEPKEVSETQNSSESENVSEPKDVSETQNSSESEDTSDSENQS